MPINFDIIEIGAIRPIYKKKEFFLMKHTIFLLIFTYFCIVLQSCVAMEYQQKELSLIKELSTIKTNSNVFYLTNEIILISDFKGLHLLDMFNQDITTIKETKYHCNIAINQNKSQIAFATFPSLHSEKKLLEIYDIPIKKTKELGTFFINTLAFNPHNNDIFLGSSIKTQEKITNISRKNNHLNHISTDFVFHPQKNLLCVIESGFISIYNSNDLTIKPKKIYLHCKNIRYYVDNKRSPISSEGIIAIKSSDETTIFLINLNEANTDQSSYISPKKIKGLMNEQFDHISFYPKNSILITLSTLYHYPVPHYTPQKHATYLKFWNTTSLQSICIIPLPTNIMRTTLYDVSPDGKSIIIKFNDNNYNLYAIPEKIHYESIKKAVYSLLAIKKYSNCYQTFPTDIIQYIFSLYWEAM